MRVRAAAAALAAVSLVACGGESAPPAATVPAPKVLRIVFPEGFTRAQMIERVEPSGRSRGSSGR